jgi:hypothetical protein
MCRPACTAKQTMLGIGCVDAEIHERWNNLSGVSCVSRGALIAFGFLDCSFRANRVFTWLRGILCSLLFMFLQSYALSL